MTNIDPAERLDNYGASLTFIFNQMIKGLHTALPGTVESYDESSRRASVRASIDVELTTGERLARPVVDNVPVVWPSGGGYSIRMPLSIGEQVLLIYSMRGLQDWFSEGGGGHPDAMPDGGIMDGDDAIAIPGFGIQGNDTYRGSGLVLQSAEDGNAFMELLGDRVSVEGDLIVNGDIAMRGRIISQGDYDAITSPDPFVIYLTG